MPVTLKIILWLGLYYATLFVAAFIVEITAPGHESIYIFRDYPSSIYASTVSFAAYGLDKLDNSRRQIFIIGGSPPGLGFLPDPLMSMLKGYKVHNLCLAGANVSEMDELVDLIEERVNLAHLDHPIFIIGGHFMSFMENERKYGGRLTELQQELVRHKICRIKNGRIAPLWGGPRTLAALKILIRPFILLYKLEFVLRLDISAWLVKAHLLSPRPPVPNTPEGYRAMRVGMFQNRGFTESQFQELNGLLSRLEAVGAVPVFVQMPVPSYIRKNFSLYEQYRRKTKYLSERKDVHVVDLSEQLPDQDFSDDAHPIASAKKLWTEELASALDKENLLASPSAGQFQDERNAAF